MDYRLEVLRVAVVERHLAGTYPVEAVPVPGARRPAAIDCGRACRV
jgi:hypothetical protein